jgi:U3 small nucleolar RNA-associated protein 19
MAISVPGSSKSKAPKKTTKGNDATLKRIAQLEAALTATPGDLNPVADLLVFLDDAEQPRIIHAAAYALHRVFSTLIRQGRLHGRLKTGDEAVSTVREWLKSRWTEYSDALCRLLGNSDGTIRVSAAPARFVHR